MSDESNVKCKCGTALYLPFNLLALSLAIILYTFLHEARSVQTALDEQSQQAGAQGQQVGAARQHYYDLYTDLVALGQTDPQALDIVQKYGIKLNNDAPKK